MFENAKWIWAEDNSKKSDRILVRKKFILEKSPKTALLRIGASDGYHLYVNGRLAVCRGGLPRESTPDNGYYDQLDIAKCLVKGDNVLGFSCWYWGEEGNGGRSASAAGLLVESPDLGIVSGADFDVYRPEGYGTTGAPLPSGLYAGGNVLYDASKGGDIEKVFEVTYGSTLFTPATEYGTYPIAPWNELYARAIPLFAFDTPVRLRKITKTPHDNTDVYEADFGGAEFAYPILELTAQGTEKIDIRTDRYTTVGGFYDNRTYNNQRIEYVCKNGAQTYYGDIPLSGTKLVITAPTSVKINAVSIRRSYYDAEAIGQFRCGNADMERLDEKCVDTLQQCMQTDLFDCPDRDRGVGLAALSAAARAIAYVYDDNALALVKKSIIDAAVFSDTALKNNAGTPFAEEKPLDSLLALSEFGVVSAYWARTGDEELLAKIHEFCARYLLLWETDESGFPVPRAENAKQFDAGYNVDAALIETCLYYSACRFVLATAFAAGETDYVESLTCRADAVKNGFEARYYKGDGYASGGCYDDRANAFAVLAGLTDAGHNAALIRLLSNVHNAGLQTESYVLEALCRLGGAEQARARLLSRCHTLYTDPAPTLPELWEGGAPCYSGSAGLLSVLYGCFAGVKLFEGKRVMLTPCLGGFDEVRFTVPVAGGKVSGLYRKEGRSDYIIENACPLEVQLNLDGKIIKIPKGKNRYND